MAAGAAYGGEYAVFASGARLRVDRHEIDGKRVRLYSGTGYTEMAAADVRGFEVEETAPVPVPAVPPPPASSPQQIQPEPVLSPRELADAAADKYGLPRELIRSVMAAESAFQPRVVSPKGAIGLMQLMPQTAQQLGVDPHDPVQNVEGGVRYLRDLLVRYDFFLWRALAAYNAGPGAVDKYKSVPPYRETINYVNRIDRAFKAAQQKSAQQALPNEMRP